MSEVAEVQDVEVEDVTEKEAAVQGWAPKDQWKGDPDKWVDAKTFLEKGQKIQAIQKERNDHLTKEVKELRQLIVEQRDMAKKARLQGYQQALEDIEQRQLQAVEEVDKEAFQKAKADEKRILKQIEDESKVPAVVEQTSDPEWEGWLDENSWYNDDNDLRDHASAMSIVIQNRTGLGGRKLYDEVKKEIKKAFPHKFGNPRRNDAGAVENGAQATIKKKSGRTFDDLPDSAKQSFSKLQKQFKLQNIDYTKDEYLSNYAWD
jgi:hypothetical protein